MFYLIFGPCFSFLTLGLLKLLELPECRGEERFLLFVMSPFQLYLRVRYELTLGGSLDSLGWTLVARGTKQQTAPASTVRWVPR